MMSWFLVDCQVESHASVIHDEEWTVFCILGCSMVGGEVLERIEFEPTIKLMKEAKF